MNGLLTSPKKMADTDRQSLVGGDVMATSLSARSDLADWVDLMEVVEALCPKWPARTPEKYTVFKL